MILRQQDFRRVTNHASRGQEVRDEARMRDRAPQTARSDIIFKTGQQLENACKEFIWELRIPCFILVHDICGIEVYIASLRYRI